MKNFLLILLMFAFGSANAVAVIDTDHKVETQNEIENQSPIDLAVSVSSEIDFNLLNLRMEKSIVKLGYMQKQKLDQLKSDWLQFLIDNEEKKHITPFSKYLVDKGYFDESSEITIDQFKKIKMRNGSNVIFKSVRDDDSCRGNSTSNLEI